MSDALQSGRSLRIELWAWTALEERNERSWLRDMKKRPVSFSVDVRGLWRNGKSCEEFWDLKKPQSAMVEWNVDRGWEIIFFPGLKKACRTSREAFRVLGRCVGCIAMPLWR